MFLVLCRLLISAIESIDGTPCEKKQLNEAEIALRCEETACKRKHLSEKRLEDEKAHVHPPSLDLMSRTRQRRSIASWHNQLASAEDRTLATHTGNGTPAEGEVDEEESGEVAAVPVVEVVPTCYRWISTSKPSPDAPPGDKKLLSFSISTSLLPVPHQPALDSDGDVIMVKPELAAARVETTGHGCLWCGRMHGNKRV
jgi:Ino eighty subunit 2